MDTQKHIVTKVLRFSKMADGLVKRNASYADIEALPEGKVGELIEGDLYVFGRPRVAHAMAISRLAAQLAPADDDTPKGWVVLFEVEIWLDKRRKTLLVPDLAGWRRERFPAKAFGVQSMEIAPDWVCEGLSPSTAGHDRGRKREVYAKYGIGHLWYADPKHNTVEILKLDRGAYKVLKVVSGDERDVLPPFSHAINLAKLWNV